MTEYDVVIRGGTIVNGTGVPRYRADLGVKDGRIAKINGKIDAGGAKEVDARGCIVAPGAIDLHTHYGAQIQWDPYASLSGWFGVASLTIGNCGFGFAPTHPEDRDLNVRMMSRIQAIPPESMEKGLRWDWETFPEFLDSLNRQQLGLNVGAMFPFSPLRGYVVGMMPAQERTSVSDSELNQMKQLFHEGMRAGAFGFSIDKNGENRTADGGRLPSNVASDREFLGLAEVLSQFGVGHVGLTLGLGLSAEERTGVRAMVADTMRISGRPLELLDLQLSEEPDWEQMCREEELPLVFQSLMSTAGSEFFKLSEYNLYDFMPSWVHPLTGNAQERAAKLREPGVRDAMKRDDAEWSAGQSDWSRVSVVEVVHERNQRYQGATIKEVADMVGKEPVDALLDLA